MDPGRFTDDRSIAQGSPAVTGAAEPPSARPRTGLSILASVFLFLLLPIPAIPALGELYNANRHSHPVSHPVFVLLGALGVSWLLMSATLYLRKSRNSSSMLLPGLVGCAIGLVGLAVDLPIILGSPSRSMRGEHTIVLALELLPMLAGIGQLLEYRRGAPGGAYVASVIVPVLLIASVFAK